MICQHLPCRAPPRPPTHGPNLMDGHPHDPTDLLVGVCHLKDKSGRDVVRRVKVHRNGLDPRFVSCTPIIDRAFEVPVRLLHSVKRRSTAPFGRAASSVNSEYSVLATSSPGLTMPPGKAIMSQSERTTTTTSRSPVTGLNRVTIGSAAWFGPYLPSKPRPRSPVRPPGKRKRCLFAS